MSGNEAEKSDLDSNGSIATGNGTAKHQRNGATLTPLSADALMRDIRQRTRTDIEKHKDKRKSFSAFQADAKKGTEHRAGDLLQSSELLFLNRFCAQSDYLHNDHLTSHRPGIIGKIISKFKRKLHSYLFFYLDRYIGSQRDFQINLVRHLNDSAKYIDGRDMSNFWELIRKIDYDVQKALDRIERINDEQTGTLRTQEKWVNETVRSNVIELRETVSRHSAEIQTLESVARGLESIVSRLKNSQLSSATNGSSIPTAEESHSGTKSVADYSYLLLENRYRGSEESISNRLSIYPQIFKESEKNHGEAPVLEIGSGRGELLSLFKEASLPAYGVDLDQAMVEAASAKGLDAKLGDGIAHLRGVQDHSLRGVIAIQVVEHLTRAQLEDLFELCTKKIRSGGRVVFETINPRSLLALSSNYFRDPTHVWPLHPDTLEYAMNLAGLQTVEVRYLSPVERDSQLRPLPVEEYMSPRLAHTIQTIDRNFEQLNSLLYGYQDYCIVAEVR
ncbi:MAG: class I SAM-dependent methyltransferase [Bdellovibrionales bacterium]|nr:class I SAM-dependent methyltransferase [Bdellovibrionales bacterium]